jgi:hypothetical protein
MAIDDEEDWSDLITHADLKREITLDLYLDEQMSEFSADLPQSDRAEQRQRLEEIISERRERAWAGDSWWEWVLGTQPLSQMGGLALVRDGKIVWATMTWIS